MATTNSSISKPEADFWRANNILPDNTNDTAEGIRRLGDVAIGGATITDAIPDAVTPSATNAVFALSANSANRGQILFGTSPLSYYLTRVMPTVVNNYVDLFSIDVANGAHALFLSIIVSDANFSVSKTYLLDIQYNNSLGAWVVLQPLGDTGAFSLNNFELLINSNLGVLSARIRRTFGATAGTAKVRIEYVGAAEAVLTELTTTGTDATVYNTISSLTVPDFWRSGTGTTFPNGTTDTTDNITHDGNIGIGVTNPATVAARLDVNGSQILRPITLANFAANAVIGAAGATVDIASVIAIPQTTPNITIALVNPTNIQPGRLLTVVNTGTVFVVVGTRQITPGTGQSWVWNNAWSPLGDSPGVVGIAASRNALATDHLKTLLVTAPSTLTINQNVFRYGLFRVRQSGAASVGTIAAGAGMTLAAPFGNTTIADGASIVVEIIGNTIYVE